LEKIKLLEKIRSKVQEHNDELVKLCSALLRINSENPPGDMGEIAGYVKDYLSEAGCRCEVVEPERGRVSIVSTIGEGEHPHLVFNGHMDVVPAGDLSRWSFDPYGGEVKDGWLLGRGASDMKCGTGGMLFAFRTIAELDVDLPGRLTIMAVPDEETGSRFGTRYLLDKGIITGDACIVGEPTGSNLVEIGQKGSVGGLIKVEGSPIHSSLSPVRGDSAVVKMARLLPYILEIHEREFEPPSEIMDVIEDNRLLYKELAGDGVEKMLTHASVNFGVIQGGTKSNIVPESCECTLDMRIPQGADHNEVMRMLEEAVRRSGVDGVTLEVRGRNAFYFSPEERIVKVAGRNVKEVLGVSPRLFIQWACSDVAAYYQKGIPTIQFGPHGLGIHGYDEKVRIENVVNAAKIYASSAIDFIVEDY
jgi:succinyl-diaminopimelate desuccinylase